LVFLAEIKGCFVSAKIQSNLSGSFNAHAKRQELQRLSLPGPTAVMANTWDVALSDLFKAVDLYCRGKRFNAAEIISFHRYCCTLKTGNQAIMKYGKIEEYDITFIKKCKTVLYPDQLIEAMLNDGRTTANHH